MAAADLINCPEDDVRTQPAYSNSRTLIASLSVVTLLLAITNYMALTDDSFRSWTVGHLSPGFKASRAAVDRNESTQRADAAAREAALTREVGALRGSLAAMTVDALTLRKSNADLAARERATSARLAIAEKHRLAGVAAAERLGSRMRTRVGKSVARQLATLPGKVLPAVGATVVVASTALELHDLCEGMRDITVLNQAVGLPALDDRDVCGVRIGSVRTVVANARRNIAATYATALQAAGLTTSPPLQESGTTLWPPAPALLHGTPTAAGEEHTMK
jgi:hypothetical protein